MPVTAPAFIFGIIVCAHAGNRSCVAGVSGIPPSRQLLLHCRDTGHPGHKKTPVVSDRGFCFTWRGGSDRLDLISLHALLAGNGDEAHALAFLQGLETAALDRAEM